MKTDDIIKPTHDNSSIDSPSSGGASSPVLDNMGLRENVILEEDSALTEVPVRERLVTPNDRSIVDIDGAGSERASEGTSTATVDALDVNAVQIAPPAPVKRTPNPNKKPKLRNLNAEQAYELLVSARTADHVELFLRDGRMIDGAILFNDMKGTGRIINVTKEISVDFRAEQVRDIRF